MGAIFYLYRRRAVNWLKESLKKPARLVVFLVIVGSLVPMMFAAFGANSPLKPEPNSILPMVFPFVTWGLCLIVFLSFLYTAASRGSIIFSMPDTQFVFTTPFKPQNVLFYGMLNMTGATLFSMFFLLYQFPNLTNAGFTPKQIFAILGIFILFLVCDSFVQQAVYLWGALHEGSRRVIRIFVVVVAFLVIAISAYMLLVKQVSFEEYAQMVRNPILLYAIPFVGWIVQMMFGAFYGITIHFWISLLLQLAVTAAVIVFSYSLDADFYEEAVEITIQRDAIIKKKKTGNSYSYNDAKRKVRKTGIGKGSGESTFFYLHLTEQRRLKPFIVSFSMLLFTVFAIALTIITKKVPEFTGDMIPIVFLGACVFALFFLTMDNPLVNDLRQPMFYYFPGSSYKKVVYASLSPLLTAAVDLIPAVLILLLLAGAPPFLMILCALCVISHLLIFLSVQLIVFRILGTIEGQVANLVYFFSVYFLVLPSLGGMIAGVFIGNLFGHSWFYLAVAGVILLQIGIFLLACLLGKGQLERGLKE